MGRTPPPPPPPDDADDPGRYVPSPISPSSPWPWWLIVMMPLLFWWVSR